MDVTNKLK